MMIITKILLEISVKILKMLENIVDILCVNFTFSNQYLSIWVFSKKGKCETDVKTVFDNSARNYINEGNIK